jgi:hypothetical protein
MERVYVDTALLAVPNYAVDQETAAQLIDRVAHFASLVEPEVPIAVILSSKAEETLWAQHCGPGYDEIAQFVDLMGIGHLFAARDLTRLYHALLDHALRSDVACPIEVCGFSDFETTPAVPDGLAPAHLMRETERIMTTVAALKLVEDGWHVGSALNGRGTTFELSATVQDATGERSNELGVLPSNLVRPVSTISNLNELVCRATSERIWLSAETADEIHLSIALGALDILERGGQTASPNRLVDFSIGPGFLESLAACQCAGGGRFSSVTRERCSQLVAGLWNRAVGPFGRPAQTERPFDPTFAWRVHLTGGHEGLRLMYWGDGSHIEFANVGVKHELMINLGEPGAASHPDYFEVFAIPS